MFADLSFDQIFITFFICCIDLDDSLTTGFIRLSEEFFANIKNHQVS